MAQPDASQAAPAKKPERIVTGQPLDLPGRFGRGWTVAGTDRQGNVLLTRPVGEQGLDTLTISASTYSAANTSPLNRRNKHKSTKQIGSAIEAPPLANGDLHVVGFDNSKAGNQTMALVEGRVDGTFVRQWVDAKLLNRATFGNNREGATQDLLKGLGLEEAVEKKPEEKKQPSQPPTSEPASTEQPTETAQTEQEAQEQRETEAEEEEDETIELNESDIEVLDQKSGAAATALATSVTAAALAPTIASAIPNFTASTTPVSAQSVGYVRQLLRTQAQEARDRGATIDLSDLSGSAASSDSLNIIRDRQTAGTPTGQTGVIRRGNRGGTLKTDIELSVPSGSNSTAVQSTTANNALEIDVTASIQAAEQTGTPQAATTAAQVTLAALTGQLATTDAAIKTLQNQLMNIEAQMKTTQTALRQTSANSSVDFRKQPSQWAAERQATQTQIASLNNHRQALTKAAGNIKTQFNALQSTTGRPPVRQLTQTLRSAQSVLRSAPQSFSASQPGSSTATKVAVGIPSIQPGSRKNAPAQTDILERLKGKISRPNLLMAALGSTQQLDRRAQSGDTGLSDTYTETLGRAGGSNRSPIATLPKSYTESSEGMAAEERGEDVMPSELLASQTVRATEQRQRTTAASLLGTALPGRTTQEEEDMTPLEETEAAPEQAEGDTEDEEFLNDEDVIEEPLTEDAFAAELAAIQAAAALEEEEDEDEEQTTQVEPGSQKSFYDLSKRFIEDMVELPESLIWMNIRLIRKFLKHKERSILTKIPGAENLAGVADHWAERGWIMCLDCLICISGLINCLIMLMFVFVALAPFLPWLYLYAKFLGWVAKIVS